MRPESSSSVRLIRGREREREALALRRRGKTFAAIGAELGFTEQAAHRAVQRALARLSEQTRHEGEQLRALELARLDDLLAAVWNAALEGETKAVLAALKVIERRCKMLGLDAPVKQELTGRNGRGESFVDALRRFGEEPPSEFDDVDVRKLSDEELDTLLALIGKAGGKGEIALGTLRAAVARAEVREGDEG
jgi:hypothetical protein